MRIHEAAVIITCETDHLSQEPRAAFSGSRTCWYQVFATRAVSHSASVCFEGGKHLSYCVISTPTKGWKTFVGSALPRYHPDVGWTHLPELPSAIVRPFLFAVLLQICSVLSNLIRAGLASPTGTKWHLVCRAAVGSFRPNERAWPPPWGCQSVVPRPASAAARFALAPLAHPSYLLWG